MNLRQLFSDWLARLSPPKTLGQRGEAAAARFLRRRGYKILARGDRRGPGELDLVVLARDRKTIVFVEVKTRRSDEAGHPLEAVDQLKQRRLTLLAVTFLKRHRLLQLPARFDVVAVTWPAGKWFARIEHVPNAFDAVVNWELYS
jgi:putative endonuclease